MTSFTCLLVWAIVLLFLPVLLIFRATEPRSARINRWRAQGLTWKACAEKLGCSATSARRWATAA